VSGTGGRTCAPRARASLFALVAPLCALVALALPLAVWADGPDPDARAGEIFRALHLEQELREISHAASAGVDASARSLPAGDRALLRMAVAAGFDPEAVGSLALGSLSERLDAEHAAAALAWLSRPGTQVLLRRSLLPAPPIALDEGRDAEDGPDRDALLRRFDRRSGRSARTEKDAALVLAAMLRVANRLLPQEQRYSEPEIEALIAAQRASARGGYPERLGLRQRYAGIPTREIEAALAFLDSESGVWLRREVDRALERALLRAAEVTVAHLVTSFGSGGAPTLLRMARAGAP
jgi:hypothetical protein